MNKTGAFKPIVITPPNRLELPDFREVWEYRDLLWLLTKRDLKVRFQQTAIGVLWIILQPLLLMAIFTIILGILIRVPTGGIPYPVFFLSGYVVWQFFSQVVNTSAYSFINNIGVITKSYFPRLALPFSSILSSLIDFVISFLVLLPFLISNHYPISIRFLLIPILLIITTFFSSGVGLIFGALMVIFRDIKNLLVFIMMIWMYITPIMFPISIVPEEYQILFFINPLTSLVESFRWVFLNDGVLPSSINLIISFAVAFTTWCVGVIAFRSMENKIADVL